MWVAILGTYLSRKGENPSKIHVATNKWTGFQIAVFSFQVIFNDILLTFAYIFRGDICLQFLFMDDNEPWHRRVVLEELLESNNNERMDAHNICYKF